MNWTSILNVASALGGMTVLIALVTLPWTLKKLRSDTKKTDADTMQVITDASGKVAENLSRQLDRMQARIDLLDQKLRDRDERDEYQDRRLVVHEQWDRKVAQKLRDLGEEIADPPPLYPDHTAA